MKNGLRLILIVLKTAVAAYLIGCVGLSWLQQLRQKLECRPLMVAATPAKTGKVRSYATEGA